MGYSISAGINKGDNEKLKGIASVIIDKSFKISNIAIFEGKKGLFVAMPRFKGKDKEGNEAYKDVCHPITAEFRKALYSDILKTFEEAMKTEEQFAKYESPDIQDSPKLKVSVFPVKEEENSKLRGFANIVLNDNFVVENIPIRENKDGKNFVAMPSYKSVHRQDYRDIVYPVTKEYHAELQQAVLAQFDKVKEMEVNPMENPFEEGTFDNRSIKRAEEMLEGNEKVARENPLASVEELEEGNYNMIDGIPNNGFGEKKQAEVDFNDVESNLNMTAADMEALSTHENVDVRKGVAANENTPANVLEELAKDEYYLVRSEVAANKNTSTDVLEDLSKDKDSPVRLAVAENENTPVNILETLAKDAEYLVRRAVALNENTPASVLETLAKDKLEVVRAEVANNKNTPATALETLAKDERQNVRQAVARNENTPVNVLEALAKDPDEGVRREVSWNKHAAHEKPVMSASNLKEAKAEKDVRDAAAPKQEQEQQKKASLEI